MIFKFSINNFLNYVRLHKNLIFLSFIFLFLCFIYICDNPIIKLKNGKVPNLIVSFTSYPPRIKTAHIAAESLLNQTLKPEKVILWLAPEEFPNREKDLPKELLDLRSKYDNFEIGWYKNIKSYKKLIPALINYPDSTIIVADDDCIYDKENVKILYKEHLKHKKDVIAFRIWYINLKNIAASEALAKSNKINIVSKNSLIPTCHMALFPKESLYKDVIKDDIFMKIDSNHDDAWYWAMMILNNTNIRKVYGVREPITIVGSQSVSIENLRKQGISTDEKVIPKIIKLYPQIKDKVSESVVELCINKNLESILYKPFINSDIKYKYIICL